MLVLEAQKRHKLTGAWKNKDVAAPNENAKQTCKFKINEEEALLTVLKFGYERQTD